MRNFSYSEFEKIVCNCTSSTSLFDFCAMHSCAVSRELLFLRLRQMLVSEDCSISFIYVIGLNSKNDFSLSDYGILLRFLRAYFNVSQSDYPTFLTSFNSYYHIDMQEADLYIKTREIF